ncbi:hypothetical protein [Streptomyces gilvus]|uniref:hypothetical protein n=1 Tax=Streptomyces gilvus TaxID=2920937 RepID=UPI001F0FEB3E|nr:hypothetical protein [Streptomyces sp. CME 23]MCH5671043.1 hypothetical protein [Streptomyces sp. CME 23]
MVHIAINESDADHDVVHWLTPVTDEEIHHRPGRRLTPAPKICHGEARSSGLRD